MKTIVSISIIILLIACSLGFYLVSTYPGEQDSPIENPDGEETGLYSQRLIVNYQDGSHSNDLITGWMYHNDRIMESVTYSLFVTPEDTVAEMMMNYYYFEYTVVRGDTQVKTDRVDFDTVNKQADGKTKIVETTFSPFEFVNYSYPDGVYTITIIPSGEILMKGEQVTLPSSFQFTVEMIDERSVDIGFN